MSMIANLDKYLFFSIKDSEVKLKKKKKLGCALHIHVHCNPLSPNINIHCTSPV